MTLVILLHIPAVQSYIGEKVASALSEKLGTEVHVGNVDLGMLNRLIIDDVDIKDQKHKDMLNVPRFSVKINILDLIQGKVNISSAQIFGMKAELYKETIDSKPNFQFVIDSLSSKGGKKKPLDVEISSLIIRRGHITWDIYDQERSETFTPNHICLNDLSTHIILNSLTDDSLNLNIKRLSANEQSGLILKKLSMKIAAGKKATQVSDLLVEMPNTNIDIPYINATYAFENNNIKHNTLVFEGKLNKSHITPCDLSCFHKNLSDLNDPVYISSIFNGTSESIGIKSLDLAYGKNTILKCNLSAQKVSDNNIKWGFDIEDLSTNQEAILTLANALQISNKLPEQIAYVGDVNLHAKANGTKNSAILSGDISTALGQANIDADINDGHFNADVTTTDLDLGKILNNESLGLMSGTINAEGLLANNNLNNLDTKIQISNLEFNSYQFSNIIANAKYNNSSLNASLTLDDSNGYVDANLESDLTSASPHSILSATVKNLTPKAMNLTEKFGDETYNANIFADLQGKDLNDITGKLSIKDFSVKSEDVDYYLNSCEIKKEKNASGEQLKLVSDFGSIMLEGHYDYNTLLASLTNAVYDRLPTFPGLKKQTKTDNIINIYATLKKSDWLQQLLNIPLDLNEPIHLVANINDRQKTLDLNVDANDFTLNGNRFRNGYILVSSPDEALKTKISVETEGTKGNAAAYTINALAKDNKLTTRIDLLINGKQTIAGTINGDVNFHENNSGNAVADINIQPSELYMNDTIWNIGQSKMQLYKNHLEVDNFIIKHGDQHIAISGTATDDANEELTLDLNGVDISYILDMVNFHKVNFSGYASGKVKANSIFSKPSANADLVVRDFRFETGRMGELLANAYWDINEGRINIDAAALDEGRKTIVKGYISPKDKDINLDITAQGTRLEFMQKFCKSFMEDVDLNGWGYVNVFGPLKGVNIQGEVTANGSFVLSSLNTQYAINNAVIKLVPNDIQLLNDTIQDAYGHKGLCNGHIYHQNLGRISYDIDVNADNLLAYDTHEFGKETFYGTAFATGKCNIKGKPGETTIDIDAVPNKGTVFVYNATSPDAIHNKDFIEWNDREKENNQDISSDITSTTEKGIKQNVRASIFMNMMIHCTPDATLKVIMDQNSGDYISLNGTGTIRGAWHNKGAFDLFGNYIVDHGTYQMTIQNVIKRNFEFLSGGSIAFGGDAYNAALNLQAQYTLNGVSLSDINIGRSFANNNVRVDCLMNITGTPAQPAVDFSLDLPTVSSDAKQMVMSLMNSEEEMNQQVIYLLAVGRFLNQGTNNSYTGDAAQQSQTSLAMQSILSGTISQQLSNMMDNIVDNNNWNIGANISTGDEGFNNAEYEGLLSGSLLNNRLLFNGQFGYRDNQNATSSFIGDFDIRYLLIPNGNAALKVYNQTNDKYFTKNSLNTQGVGIILKKDFNSWRDLFFRRKKVTFTKEESK